MPNINQHTPNLSNVSHDTLAIEQLTVTQEIDLETYAFCNSFTKYDELLNKLTSTDNSNLNLPKIEVSPQSKNSTQSVNEWDTTPNHSSNRTSLTNDINFNDNYILDSRALPYIADTLHFKFLEDLDDKQMDPDFMHPEKQLFPLGDETVPKSLDIDSLSEIDKSFYNGVIELPISDAIQPHLTMNKSFSKVEKPNMRRKASNVEQVRNQLLNKHQRTASAASIISTRSTSIPLPGAQKEVNEIEGLLKAEDFLTGGCRFEDNVLLSQPSSSFDATWDQSEENFTKAKSEINILDSRSVTYSSQAGLIDSNGRGNVLEGGSTDCVRVVTPTKFSSSDDGVIAILPVDRQSVEDLPKINQSSHRCDGCFKISKTTYGCSNQILNRLPNLKSYTEYNTPNGYNLEFAKKHGDPNFVYQRSEQNTYYDPAVKRYSLEPEYDSKGRRMKTDYPSLCPFCKVTPSRGIDDLFYERNNSCYRGHLINTHGISSKGESAMLPTAGFVCYKLGKNSWTETFGFKCPYSDCTKCFIRGDKTHGFHEYIRHWNGKHIQKVGTSP